MLTKFREATELYTRIMNIYFCEPPGPMLTKSYFSNGPHPKFVTAYRAIKHKSMVFTTMISWKVNMYRTDGKQASFDQ